MPSGNNVVPEHHQAFMDEAKKFLKGKQFVLVLVDPEDQTQIDMASSFAKPDTEALLTHVLDLSCQGEYAEVKKDAV